MVFNPTGKRGDPDYVLVNPKIIRSNDQTDIVEEGCLSFPKIYGDVQVPPESQCSLEMLDCAFICPKWLADACTYQLC